MTRKTKKIIIILGALVLLGGAYYGSTVYRYRQLTRGVEPLSSQPRLGNMEWRELVRIETPDLILERTGDIWELVYLAGGIPPGIELDQREIQGMLFPLSNMWIDRTVDEEPEDISIFGFDNPSSHVILTDSFGNTVEYIRGDMAPTRLHYFVMQKGDPAVYAVPSFHGGLMRFPLDSIRLRSLFPHFELNTVTHLWLESPDTPFEIIARPVDAPPHMFSPFASHIMISPYSHPWGVNMEALQNFLIPFVNLSIADFIDDNPSSLAPFGLDRATRVFLQTRTRNLDLSLDLLIGNEINGRHFAKLPDAPGVFTLNGMESVINTRPFPLIDKFPILINIDFVDRLTISGGERLLTADIEGTGPSAIFHLNGRKAEERSFRVFYQSVIGLLVDAEYTGAGSLQNNGAVTIEFLLNSPAGERVTITLYPYNRDFYVLRQNGAREFFISRNQVRRIFETADAVVFE